MLQFETWKITLISLICVIGVVFSIPNLFSEDEIKNFKFFNKQINLGLDLQGGSYILLEADMDNVFSERTFPNFCEGFFSMMATEVSSQLVSIPNIIIILIN